ncbi:hypothetical protein LCGC14_0798430 [marine sediment metagenome]|uniref:Uncharacterized protein n=1 Tax=marine sediment metagenome TaxID=412755 RepID=A0A0F9SAE3_9ZZZZ
MKILLIILKGIIFLVGLFRTKTPQVKAEKLWAQIEKLNNEILDVTNLLTEAMRNDHVVEHKSLDARRMRLIAKRNRLIRQRQHHAERSAR